MGAGKVRAMRSSFFGASALFLCACLGCGNSGNVVGNWIDETHNVSVRFNGDGTYEQETHKGQAKVTALGTYTLSRNHLVMTTKDVKFENVPTGQAEYKQELLSKPPDEGNVEFVGENQINIIRGPISETFSRG